MGCPIHDVRVDVPSDRVSEFNYRTDAGMISNPWVTLRDLGTGPGLFYSRELGGHWCATKRETVIEILRNWELFSSKSIRVPPVDRAVASIPHHLDPPAHGQYRLSVVELFGHTPGSPTQKRHDKGARTVPWIRLLIIRLSKKEAA